MKTTVAIEAVGYGISGNIGGLPKTTYYTPDGRIIRTIANFHTNAAGQVRDANLDRGWLLSPPQVPKLFCQTCDYWHDTQKEVADCKSRRQKLIKQAGLGAKKEMIDKTSSLEQRVVELTAMVEKLMEGKNNGTLLQPKADEPTQVPGLSGAKRGTGRRTSAVLAGAK